MDSRINSVCTKSISWNFGQVLFLKEDDDEEEEEGGAPAPARRSLERLESAVDITEKFVYEHMKNPA